VGDNGEGGAVTLDVYMRLSINPEEKGEDEGMSITSQKK